MAKLHITIPGLIQDSDEYIVLPDNCSFVKIIGTKGEFSVLAVYKGEQGNKTLEYKYTKNKPVLKQHLTVMEEDIHFSSSSIQRITYDANSFTLGICFKTSTDTVYLYNDITEQEFVNLLVEDSIGKFYVREIKPRIKDGVLTEEKLNWDSYMIEQGRLDLIEEPEDIEF